MGKLLRFMKRDNKREYDFERLAMILVRKKIEHRSDLKMLRNLIRDLQLLTYKPELVKAIWEGIGYRYVKRGKVFAYSERALENNEEVEEILLGGIKFGKVPKYYQSEPKYMVRAEAEYMEIKRLASDLFSIAPDLLKEGLSLNFSDMVIAGYFKIEDALLMDLAISNLHPYTLVEEFISNKYREDKPKQNRIYYIIARSLFGLHVGFRPNDIYDYGEILVNLRENFRVARYIENNIKTKYFVQSECIFGHVKSDDGEVMHKALNTTLLLHDLLLTLDMKELAKSFETQRPVYLCCFGNPELKEEEA